MTSMWIVNRMICIFLQFIFIYIAPVPEFLPTSPRRQALGNSGEGEKNAFRKQEPQRRPWQNVGDHLH